jgi:hypothetical protein
VSFLARINKTMKMGSWAVTVFQLSDPRKAEAQAQAQAQYRRVVKPPLTQPASIFDTF